MKHSEKIINDANLISKDMQGFIDKMKSHCDESGKEFDYDAIRSQYIWMKFAQLEDRINRIIKSIIDHIDRVEQP